MTDLHTVEIAAVLRQLTARLIASDDLDEALEDLVDTAADLVEGASWCAVTLVRAGGPSTAAASSELPEELLDSQYHSGTGPSMEAIRARDLILSDDLTVDTRWPEWRERALAAGVRGVLTVPVDIDEQVVGALTVYSAESGRFTADVGLTAVLVAEHAGLLLAAVLDRGRQAGLHAALAEALADGETVNRAIGIMMVQRGCSAEAALDGLQRTASRLDLPLSTVAQRLVETVERRATV
ncbi:GAF and ANTAR domain-containing protein [Dactylosporangium roseum]|uniref:GAF and ANTAR domain-containing protein n=2 Tax=Dactylosporangium TaxID=35753 RepID=A0ABY5VWE8_9ACTN|nr:MULTISPECIES: GAF and ANTAR domain-containing protein [Dactylosporangium]UWP81567.1 GAF and ANTAR domain-containing protein [Dactylosporangium fulvum]UWZ35650.1 GAF and ANTAR domain-containing protein [Dactylosporangium roseum]